jgi:WD40 repeat protein
VVTARAPFVALLLAVLLSGAAVFFLARGRAELLDGARDLRSDNAALSEALDQARARERELRTDLDDERARAAETDAALDADRRELFLARMRAAVRASETGRWTTFDAELAGVPEEHRGWLWRHLRLRRALAVRPIETGGHEVAAVALSADGERFAAGTAQGTVHVGSVRTGEVTSTFALEDEEVSAVALSRDGARIAVGTYSGLVEVRAVGEAESLDWFAADEGPAGIAFLPGADGLAAAFVDGAVCVWRLGDEEPLWLEGHTFPANAVSVSPDGARVASAADDGTVQLYEGAGFADVRVLEAHEDWVRAVAFDGNERLVSGAEDGVIVVWDVARGEPLEVLPTDDGVIAAVAAADGALVCVSDEGRVRAWRGRETERSELPIGARGPLSVTPALTAAGVLVYAASDGELHLRDPAGRRARVVLRPDGGAVRAVAASDDGGVLAAACADGTLRVLDGETGEPRSRLRAGGGIVRAVALSPDGSRAAAGSRVVTVFDTRTGEVLHTFGEDRRFVSLSFAADGNELLAVGSDGSGHLFDLRAGELVRECNGPPGLVFAVTAGPRAQRFAWIGDGGTVRVWEARTGARVGALRERDLGRVDWLALAADGARLGAVVDGTRVSVLGVGPLAEERAHVRARGPQLMYLSIALSPSSERFAAGTYEGELALFDAVSGTFLALLDAGDKGLAGLEFSRDGSRLVAGSSSGELFVWETDLAAHQRLARGPETKR